LILLNKNHKDLIPNTGFEELEISKNKK
jgi:hypothetical protein